MIGCVHNWCDVVLVEPGGLQPDGRYFVWDEIVVLITCLPPVSSQIALITGDAKEGKDSPLLKGNGGMSDGICCKMINQAAPICESEFLRERNLP